MGEDLSIGAVLSAAARRAPEAPWLVAPESGRVLRREEAHAAAARLAARLRAAGVASGDRVAVVLENGPNAVVALLGIMAAGAVAVPLDPRLTSAEMSVVLEETRPALGVTDAAHAAAAPGGAEGEPCEGLELEPGNPLRLCPPPAAAAPRRLTPGAALILYTSGTTGRPKGVVLTHRNLLANARQVATAHALGAADVALCVLPVFHINGFVVTTLAPLLSGGSVVMPRRFDVGRFWGWVAAHRATWFSAVPTILSRLLSAPAPRRPDVASLRFARSASAPLPVAVLERFEAMTGVPVVESYGISEAAGQVTSNPLPPAPRKPGSVGLAFGNAVQVVDGALRPLPAGASGEVAVRGESVFSGYLDRPDADRETLRDGWLLTGDLGHLDGDGYLFLTGRRKELINRAGEKISPREVEEALHRCEDVELACVVGVPHPEYGEEVVAFVSLRPGRTATPEALAARCRERLAPFKVPKQIVLVDELPRGPNGKLQRRGLVETFQRMGRSFA